MTKILSDIDNSVYTVDIPQLKNIRAMGNILIGEGVDMSLNRVYWEVYKLSKTNDNTLNAVLIDDVFATSDYLFDAEYAKNTLGVTLDNGKIYIFSTVVNQANPYIINMVSASIPRPITLAFNSKTIGSYMILLKKYILVKTRTEIYGIRKGDIHTLTNVIPKQHNFAKLSQNWGYFLVNGVYHRLTAQFKLIPELITTATVKSIGLPQSKVYIDGGYTLLPGAKLDVYTSYNLPQHDVVASIDPAWL